MIEKKTYSRTTVWVLIVVIVVLLAGLVGTVTYYTQAIKTKDVSLSAKDSQIDDLQNQIVSKDAQIADYIGLQANYSRLQANYSALQNEYVQLGANFTGLEAEFNDLIGNYSMLNATYQNLSVHYSQLDSNYTNLLGVYNMLDSSYKSLQTEYDQYVAAYQRLRERINQRWNEINVKPFITLNDPAVSSIVYQITGGWSNRSDFNEFWDDVKAMYDWVLYEIDYRYDGLTPKLPSDPSSSLTFSTDMWQFSNETLDVKQGDCEDMAILLCSMIRYYTNRLYPTECILIRSSSSGHAAVQILVKGGKLVIFDPAGDYYSQDYWGDIVFNEITVEIDNWLDYWKPDMGSDVYVDRVFSDAVDETFGSTGGYIDWMYTR